jgi:hypothetical protein
MPVIQDIHDFDIAQHIPGLGVEGVARLLGVVVIRDLNNAPTLFFPVALM